MDEFYSKSDRVIVTGASGMVGSALVAHLIKEGYSNINLIVRSKKNLYLLKRVLKYNDILDRFNTLYIYECDLTNYNSLCDIIQHGDIIFNTASKVDMNDITSKVIINNVKLSHCLAQSALQKGAKLIVHTSSIASLGDFDDINKVTENSIPTSIAQKSPYSQSKFYSEGEFQRACSTGDLGLIIVNPSVIIGIGEFRGKGSASIFRRLSKGLSYYPSGSTGYVSVEDVAIAMERLSQNSNAIGERFLLNCENLSYKDFITKITTSFGVKSPTEPIKKSYVSIAKLIIKFLNKLGINTIISHYTISTLQSETKYDGDKIKKFIDFEYHSIDNAIYQCVEAYKKEL